MNKFIASNITQLQKLKQKSITSTTTQTNKKRIDELIKLYTQRKISNVATVENLIKGLTSSNKQLYDKTFKKYKENISKYKETKPLNERMNESKKRKRNRTYFVDFQLYTYVKGNLKEQGIKQKPSFTHQGLHYFITTFQIQNATITIKSDFPKERIGRRIFRWNTLEDYSNSNENPEFQDTLDLLSKDEEVSSTLEFLRTYYDDLACVKIRSVDLVNKNGEKFDIMTENLTEASNISIYHNYISTPIKTDADTIKRAIEKKNYIDNLCWANALMDFYGDTIMGEKCKKRLTIDRIIEITGKNDFTETGASIADMEKVFKEYNIQVRIFDFFNKLIYKYDPEKRNHHLKTFYAMVKNSHIYVLNHNLKEIQQKHIFADIPVVKASADYYINQKEEPTKFKMIDNVNDILQIKFDDNDVSEVFMILKNNNLNEAFFELVANGYEPKITFQAGVISQIKIKFNKTNYIIKTQNLLNNSCDGAIAVSDEQTYNNMNEALFNFNKTMFSPSHKSFYNDIDIDILDETRTIVPSGTFCKKILLHEKSEIDVRKAFTHSGTVIDEIPVFNQFDIWKEYDGTIDVNDLHNLTLYYVELKSTKSIPDVNTTLNVKEHMKELQRTLERYEDEHYRNQLIALWGKEEFEKYIEQIKARTVNICNKLMEKSSKTGLMLNKKRCLIYGLFLKELMKHNQSSNINILYYKIPSQIHKVNYQNIINDLWQMTISDDNEEDEHIKKLIANVNFGLLEKGGATSQKSIVFKNIDEALENQAVYGGKLHRLSDVELDYENEYEEEKQNYYILNLKDTVKLRNGFRYIKELLLQHHNFKMNNAYYKLIKNGIPVYSVKTDAFVIDTLDVITAKRILDFNDNIGGWRVSKSNDDIALPCVNYEIVQNEMINIPSYDNEEIAVDDEYNTDSIIDKIVEQNPVIIRGLFAGTGKSYICQRMVERNYKVIFVCPTNKLLQAFEGEAMTINKFFGISFADVKLEPFDYSGYDVIVFDEIYFSNLNRYWRIKQFVEKNKSDKIIIATGDTKQLKPLQELTNIQDYETYADHIIDNIFKHNILLKECKRLNTQEDKDKLTNIKNDIFINKIPTRELIDKYFSYTTDISGSKNNIAFLNNTCKNVSDAIRKLENRKGEYEIGEFLICREYTKVNSSVFNVNFKYQICYVGNGIMKLKDVKSMMIQPISIEKVRDNFIFAYCSTCHSAQGSSIDDTITIFDYNHFLVKNYPEWIWTALTRCRDLNKVKFFKYSSDTNDEFNEKCIMSYFDRKIETYKLQDRKAHRNIPKQGYVNAEWFCKNIKNQCNYCGCGFHLDIRNGNIMSNLTAQRKNNDLTHTLDNIIPYCCRCNCSCK